ncbi:DUF995 domain-containing protein [Paraburkholderia caffeinitolerans]|uniref:DUF995 domain-containing protein n=1 Tax=Paraburkholderia caffeinitolerans TaxID=1723730 RepID=UPI001581F53F|nr:DUF995 domain-containing protein [Paraburkholderia caffeinitolerans]
MKRYRSTSLAFALLAIGTAGTAGTAAFAENSSDLSADELKQILPGATVVVTYANGNSARWKNESDGTLSASWNNGPEVNSKHHHAAGTGTWKISDDGKFCAHIEWPTKTADWCRPVVKSDDGSYTLRSLQGSPSWNLEISK